MNFGGKSFWISIAVSLGILVIVALISIRGDATKIVFCDVGQGDGIYIRTHNDIDLIIDAGEGGRMLECLGSHMPFFDRSIEIAFITHPDKDHYGGMVEVARRYSLGTVFIPHVINENGDYIKFLDKLTSEENTDVLFYKDKVSLSEKITLEVLWPTKTFVSAKTYTSENKKIPLDETNVFSYVLLFREDAFSALLTGDVNNEILENLDIKVEDLSILKVPHHGAKDSLSKGFLESKKPQLAIISAGRNNRFGHPATKTTLLLKETSTDFISTQEHGSVVFIIKDGAFTLHDQFF